MVLKIFILVQTIVILYDWWGFSVSTIDSGISRAVEWLYLHHLVLVRENTFIQCMIILFALIFIRSVRKILLMVSKRLRKWIALLPSKMTLDLLQRYLKLARFTIYKDQSTTFGKLVGQYPSGTKFVVLPMDMEYMGAGKLAEGSHYRDQMEGLLRIKKYGDNRNALLPFIFAHPERILNEKGHFRYEVREGKVLLKHSFIQEYLEKHRFNGIKIYPALGYYPFDEALLPLWKYAADNGIPILTHCIKGTIFYRGRKKREWDYHPVFKELASKKEPKYDQLLLPQRKNKDFTINFTHPMNYLILLDEELLRIWVSKCSPQIQELFGFTNLDSPLKHNLEHLKLCLGHFGGKDQWDNFLDADRDEKRLFLSKNLDEGLELIRTKKGELSWDKMERNWKYLDWYSIICSMMHKYDNVYADISYILHEKEIFPLLKQTIHRKDVGEKVLYGTDFFVVRNHSTEKSLLADTEAELTTEEFDKIARENPQNFLSSRFYPAKFPETIDEIESV